MGERFASQKRKFHGDTEKETQTVKKRYHGKIELIRQKTKLKYLKIQTSKISHQK